MSKAHHVPGARERSSEHAYFHDCILYINLHCRVYPNGAVVSARLPHSCQLLHNLCVLESASLEAAVVRLHERAGERSIGIAAAMVQNSMLHRHT